MEIDLHLDCNLKQMHSLGSILCKCTLETHIPRTIQEALMNDTKIMASQSSVIVSAFYFLIFHFLHLFESKKKTFYKHLSATLF